MGRSSGALQQSLASSLLVLVLIGYTAGAMDERRMLDIRSSIVEALGLQRIPDPAKANVSQAEYERAHKEYLTRLRRSAGERDQRQRRLFTMEAHGERAQEGIALTFPQSVEKPGRDLVESAVLRLMLDHEEDSSPTNLEIRVYRKRTPDAKRRRLVSRKTIGDPEDVRLRWLEFDLSDEVAAASVLGAQAPIHLHVQLLRKDYSEDNVRPARGFGILASALNVHTIALAESEASHLRSRRSLSARERVMSLHRGRRTECRGEAKKCCRHRMTVNFKDLDGFDFIIQPKSFDAGYCKGRCPPRFNPAHHHALLQSLIWKEDRKKAPRPCCAPSKLTELEILYFDESDRTKLKVSNWKDMKVLECACS